MNSDWFNAGNWDNGAPTEEANVVLQWLPTTLHEPIIDKPTGGEHKIRSLVTETTFTNRHLQIDGTANAGAPADILMIMGANVQSRFTGGTIRLSTAGPTRG